MISDFFNSISVKEKRKTFGRRESALNWISYFEFRTGDVLKIKTKEQFVQSLGRQSNPVAELRYLPSDAAGAAPDEFAVFLTF